LPLTRERDRLDAALERIRASSIASIPFKLRADDRIAVTKEQRNGHFLRLLRMVAIAPNAVVINNAFGPGHRSNFLRCLAF
jgi:hypothetical protein